ncbi:FAD-dependent oxidoreductase [Actinomyces polynesiensis]|uniref:FAD-dependent oxidoreductase n=1 Tax=Actinomyces polynesiensis TaxID=1325934 RepID=UPI0009E5C952|nr:FAD-dependent oxidoreductase [Actinomyces polynesiensis]
MEEEHTDVIVVGAGPAGSACALTLAQAGRSVILVDRGATPGARRTSPGDASTPRRSTHWSRAWPSACPPNATSSRSASG